MRSIFSEIQFTTFDELKVNHSNNDRIIWWTFYHLMCFNWWNYNLYSCSMNCILQIVDGELYNSDAIVHQILRSHRCSTTFKIGLRRPPYASFTFRYNFFFIHIVIEYFQLCTHMLCIWNWNWCVYTKKRRKRGEMNQQMSRKWRISNNNINKTKVILFRKS